MIFGKNNNKFGYEQVLFMADELSDERSECGDSDNQEDGDGDTTATAHHKSD